MGMTLKTREVAEALGVSTHTVRRYADAGVLPVVRLTPRSPRRFCSEDVARLLEAAQAGTR
jgi:excisionase family DNA binding protein